MPRIACQCHILHTNAKQFYMASNATQQASKQQLVFFPLHLYHGRFVPSLNWLEQSYRQAKKHYSAAEAADVAALLWAWGEFGYTPKDKLFMNEMKDDVRRRFKQHAFDGQQLVQLMHGVARWADYHPNERWLLAYANEIAPCLHQLSAGEVMAAANLSAKSIWHALF